MGSHRIHGTTFCGTCVYIAEMAASHFLQVQVKSQVISVQVQVKSQVIWSKHKSSHKSLCPSTSQVAHYFFHSRHKKGNIIKSKRK